MPGATSAGLASAYEERFRSYEKPRKNYSCIFYGSVICLAVLALIPLSWFGVDKSWLQALIWKVPLFVPFIWAAIFSATRANEMTHLMEGYVHKWTLAKSYEGYKKQVLDLGGEKSPLMEKLLEYAINNLSYNVSDSLDKVKREEHPYQKILDKLGDITSFLKK